MSRRHATLEVVAGQLQVVDQGAVNGTFVNDHRIEASSARWAGCGRAQGLCRARQ